MDLTLEDFAASVGVSDPVTISGMATRGGPSAGARIVTAPVGIDRIDAAEMVVECGAGTAVDELLAALAEHGQTVSLPAGGTVGGALAVGRSDITRLGHGAMRDVLLQTNYVSAAGKLTKAGGPTVKNVSGFDLCRLFVGSHGTLGFFGDVILRTRPIARTSNWFTSSRDPFELLHDLHRPVSLLWNGSTAWVRLDGDASDVAKSVDRFALETADGPPTLPEHRWSLPPSELPALRDDDAGSFVAEVGVGVVHRHVPAPARSVDAATRQLHDRVKAQFDPTSRLNPGVDPVTV